jgi:hypothetical protein
MKDINRTLEKWALVRPDAFLDGSIVQARNVIEMAQQDIATLGEERRQLRICQKAQSDTITICREENAALTETLKDVLVSLIAAHSLLEHGGKKAAPSNTMFEIMLSDYAKSIARGRKALGVEENSETGGQQ